MRIRIKQLHRCTTFFLIICVSFLLPITALAQSPDTDTTNTQNGPKIIFETQVHDFGTVKPKTSLTHEFVFTNKGTAELLIEKIKAGWGCTAALASASEIPPGGEGKIKVTFKPGNREGVQKKTVLVDTNDPAGRKLKLEIRANVEMVLALSPSRIVFPAFVGKNGSKDPLFVRLSGKEGPSVKILSVESSNKLIKTETNLSGLDDAPDKQIKVSVLPGMAIGRFRDTINIKTDSETVPTLTLNVMGEVLGNISVTPRHLPLGMITPANDINKAIELQATDDDYSFNVLEVSSTAEGVATEIEAIVPGKQYKIIVSMPDGASKTIVRGNIVITTDDPEQQTITVRVFGRIKPGTRPEKPVPSKIPKEAIRPFEADEQPPM